MRVTYEESEHVADLNDPNAGEGKLMEPLSIAWGDAEAALAASRLGSKRNIRRRANITWRWSRMV